MASFWLAWLMVVLMPLPFAVLAWLMLPCPAVICPPVGAACTGVDMHNAKTAPNSAAMAADTALGVSWRWVVAHIPVPCAPALLLPCAVAVSQTACSMPVEWLRTMR